MYIYAVYVWFALWWITWFYVLLQHNKKLNVLTDSKNYFNKFTKGSCTSAFETTFLILTMFFEISSSPITTATGMPLSSQYWIWFKNFGLTRYDCSVYNTKTRKQTTRNLIFSNVWKADLTVWNGGVMFGLYNTHRLRNDQEIKYHWKADIKSTESRSNLVKILFL